MPSYTLAQACKQYGKIFAQAAIEPVLLTKRSRPSHLIKSVDPYQRLMKG